jgi:hypothetical protein
MMTERHELACSIILKAIRRTGSLGSCSVSIHGYRQQQTASYAKSLDSWYSWNSDYTLYQSGSFCPTSQTNLGLPSAVQVLSSPRKQKNNRQAFKGVGFQERQGATERDWERLSSTASHWQIHFPQTAPTQISQHSSTWHPPHRDQVLWGH